MDTPDIMKDRRRYLLTVPDDIYKKLKELKKSTGLSMSAQINIAVRDYLERRRNASL